MIGEKVRLRPVEREDLPRFVRWFGDAEVRRHLAVYLPFSLIAYRLSRIADRGAAAAFCAFQGAIPMALDEVKGKGLVGTRIPVSP